MRVMFLVTGAALGFALPAAAQQGPDMVLPEIVIGGDKKPAPDSSDCDDAKIDGKSDYDCLNRGLKRDADRGIPTLNIPPVGTHSSDVSRGIVNIPALKQQYGPNYGISVVPSRPPPPVHPKP